MVVGDQAREGVSVDDEAVGRPPLLLGGLETQMKKYFFLYCIFVDCLILLSMLRIIYICVFSSLCEGNRLPRLQGVWPTVFPPAGESGNYLGKW